jgi:hypothetical protein
MTYVFVICLLQQSPTVMPTEMNCDGAFADCAPTVSPTRDLSEDQKEATILAGIIVSIAMLSLAFVFAGKYYDVWYPMVAKKFGWNEEGDIKLEDFSSTHSETALVDRHDKRRTPRDSHQSDIENVSFTVDGATKSAFHKSPKRNGNHVKFASETEMTVMKGNKVALGQSNQQEAAAASATEIEIAANISKEGEAQSRDLLFGESAHVPAASETETEPQLNVTASAVAIVDDVAAAPTTGAEGSVLAV